MEKEWTVYILECGDGTLYTGITDDLPRRLKAHREGRGAKYTRGRAPLMLRYRETAADKSAALRRECAIKRMPRCEKLALICSLGSKEKDLLAICEEKVYTDNKKTASLCPSGKEEKTL